VSDATVGFTRPVDREQHSRVLHLELHPLLLTRDDSRPSNSERERLSMNASDNLVTHTSPISILSNLTINFSAHPISSTNFSSHLRQHPKRVSMRQLPFHRDRPRKLQGIQLDAKCILCRSISIPDQRIRAGLGIHPFRRGDKIQQLPETETGVERDRDLTGGHEGHGVGGEDLFFC
jgi:hypothetical protein